MTMRNIRIKTRCLAVAVATLAALAAAAPAAAQSNGGGKASLSVRKERQSASSGSRKSKKTAAETAKPAAKKETKLAATPANAAAAAKTVAGKANLDTAKSSGGGQRQRFVPRAQRAAQQSASAVSDDRAQMDFPTAPEMPKDVSWRRDIYRRLDLTQDANAALYYPLEQQGDQINLFTYLMKLILRGQVKAYDYSLNGNENFDAKNQVKPKDILDRYHIYYESKDGRTHINDSDIPAAEVTEYFVKESSYFDQHTATYHTRVTALCPVMKRADDFGGADASYPMFWVKYDDISPYLAKLPLTGSNYNNAATMSADDFFAMNRYKGKIYKTNNLQGKVLANYATTDSAMTREQDKIEKQLSDFEQHIWGNDSTDSTKVKADTVAATGKQRRTRSLSKRRGGSEASATTKRTRSSGSSAGSPRVSVRRQRH